MTPTIRDKDQASMDKKNLYVPLYKTMGNIIKRLKELEIDLQLSKIAWMEVRGEFSAKRHRKLKRALMDFLRITYEYEKIYLNLIQITKRKFEVEMVKDGSFAPGVKEYESLKNEIPNVILKGKKKVWVNSYNDYLPKIRERSTKTDKKPRSGTTMYKAIYNEVREVKAALKTQQKESLEAGLEIRKGLKYVKLMPQKPWGYWEEKIEDIKEKKSEKVKKDSDEKKKN